MPAEPILSIRPAPGPASPITVEDLRARPEAGKLTPLLIDMAGLSLLLARSKASLFRDDAAGRIPAGRKLGASKRWVYSEIVAWVEAGMPARKVWEAMKDAKKASGRPR
jgi:predicted DNA-binding transcriptional regulator AlpA